MTLNEYQTLAARTIASDDVNKVERHALFGLTAEIGELVDVCITSDIEHTLKECGDVCWMCAELCTAQGWYLGEIVNCLKWKHEQFGLTSNVFRMAVSNGELNGTYQKVLQGHQWDVDTVKSAIDDIFFSVRGIAEFYGTTLESVLQTNIEKLKARYPDGFDPDRSLHRADGDV